MPNRYVQLALLGASLLVYASGSYSASVEANNQSSQGSSSQPVNPVLQWNRTLLVIVRTPGAQPATVHPTRSFAIMHAAVYDAVNAIDATHKPYLVHVEHVSPHASQEAAAATAARETLVALYPASQPIFDLQLEQSLAAIPDGVDKTAGVDVGKAVAQAILALRND